MIKKDSEIFLIWDTKENIFLREGFFLGQDGIVYDMNIRPVGMHRYKLIFKEKSFKKLHKVQT